MSDNNFTIDQKTVIERLNELIKKSSEINFKSEIDYSTWQNSVEAFLVVIFGEKHHHTIKVQKILKVFVGLWFGTDEDEQRKLKYKKTNILTCIAFLKEIITQIESLGLETVKHVCSEITPQKENVINFTQHQTQHQNQSISYEIFIDLLKNELKDGEIQALKNLLEEYKRDNNPSKVLKHLKTLGNDVLSNIFAGIILNPNIVNNLLGLL